MSVELTSEQISSIRDLLTDYFEGNDFAINDIQAGKHGFLVDASKYQYDYTFSVIRGDISGLLWIDRIKNL